MSCDLKCGSDFVAKTMNVVKLDNERPTIVGILNQYSDNLGKIQYNIFFSFVTKQG